VQWVSAPRARTQSFTSCDPAYVFLHVKHVVRLSHVPSAGSASPPLIGRPLLYVPGLLISHTDIAFCATPKGVARVELGEGVKRRRSRREVAGSRKGGRGAACSGGGGGGGMEATARGRDGIPAERVPTRD
jgi:hypothetical protein